MPGIDDTAVLIVAAGRGSRAGGLPKQYRRLAGRPVLLGTIEAFRTHPSVGPILVVIHPDDRALYDAAVTVPGDRLLPPVPGGATRQASVLAGLRALRSSAPRRVLIHDAARPFLEARLIGDVLAALEWHDGAIPALPVADTLKRADDAGLIAATVPRAGLHAAQTPQGFRFAAILAAHEAASARSDFTDDAAIAEWHGMRVALVPGSARNIKLTTAEDIAMAEERLAFSDIRTGQGFDVHRLVAGDHVMLCGVRIPHERALEGHSDADVALHAATDALLGAIGDGDIGVHFPPSSPQWRGASSDRFLAFAAGRVRALGGTIANVDITILCEQPKVSPHREAMRARLAQILGIEAARTAVKATTTERLGFTGREEGIAALAVATVRLPSRP
jgi:2-C-methyl-D-erythritol 4-phosphate cytidylyltransferase/2-C-methyl-D-erythritol 2,4-cyclodiphosphate synthase